MNNNIIEIENLRGQQLSASDPFLFCVHHKDSYPEGNKEMGPKASLNGRMMGNDFNGLDGWNMYHGKKVPGFPQHPHRGFETVTIVLEGVVDHGDSKGGSGRYAAGDVQWLTAGRGCNHSEMFPLINENEPNPMELFQIWLNLPKKDKLVDPHYKMLWEEDIPVIKYEDENKKHSFVTLVSGEFNNNKSLDSSPNSWASKKENHVGIMIIKMDKEATITLPKVSATLNRNIYFYKGESIKIDNETINVSNRVKLNGNSEITITNGLEEGYILLLEGEPIGEPVAIYGPFVMNTREDIQQTMKEYRETEFGGWPLDRDDFIHSREQGRFARYTNGEIEYK